MNHIIDNKTKTLCLRNEKKYKDIASLMTNNFSNQIKDQYNIHRSYRLTSSYSRIREKKKKHLSDNLSSMSSMLRQTVCMCIT